VFEGWAGHGRYRIKTWLHKLPCSDQHQRGTIVEQPVTHVASLAVTIRWRIYGRVIQESSLVAGQIADLLIDIAIRAGNDNMEIVVPLSVVVRIVRGNWTSP
jgi:hypothetical protein